MATERALKKAVHHVLRRMQNDVFPWLGKRPIAEIDAPEILVVLKRIDARGARYSIFFCRGRRGQPLSMRV